MASQNVLRSSPAEKIESNMIKIWQKMKKRFVSNLPFLATIIASPAAIMLTAHSKFENTFEEKTKQEIK